MRPRAHLARGPLPDDARRERRGVEPERAEHVVEQEVLLEAVAAAAAVHELALERRQIEPDGPTDERVEVLERNRERVQRLQRAQRLERRGARPRVADALEIRVDVEHSPPTQIRRR